MVPGLPSAKQELEQLRVKTYRWFRYEDKTGEERNLVIF